MRGGVAQLRRAIRLVVRAVRYCTLLSGMGLSRGSCRTDQPPGFWTVFPAEPRGKTPCEENRVGTVGIEPTALPHPRCGVRHYTSSRDRPEGRVGSAARAAHGAAVSVAGASAAAGSDAAGSGAALGSARRSAATRAAAGAFLCGHGYGHLPSVCAKSYILGDRGLSVDMYDITKDEEGQARLCKALTHSVTSDIIKQ